MIDPTHELPVTRQAKLLGLSRSSVYYQPCPISDRDLALMHRLDKLHLEYPFAGARMLRDMLWQEDVHVGRRHVRTQNNKTR
jgi:putative transposase